jgi:hypothetical protein
MDSTQLRPGDWPPSPELSPRVMLAGSLLDLIYIKHSLSYIEVNHTGNRRSLLSKGVGAPNQFREQQGMLSSNHISGESACVSTHRVLWFVCSHLLGLRSWVAHLFALTHIEEKNPSRYFYYIYQTFFRMAQCHIGECIHGQKEKH